MKKLLLIVTLLISLMGYSQFQFPETEVNLLLNKELKVITSDTYKAYGFRNFYKSLDFDYKNELTKNYDMLAGKIFTVSAIENYSSTTGKPMHKLTLNNAETGTVYFNYNPKNSFEFPFDIIGGIKMPDGYYCDQLTSETDKFSGEVKTTSKMFQGFMFLKSVKDKKASYYLMVSALAPTAVVGKTGVIILLANGKKIEKPAAKIDIDANKYGKDFKYTSLIQLTPTDITLLTSSPMTDARLYIFDSEIKEGIKMMETLKCLIK